MDPEAAAGWHFNLAVSLTKISEEAEALQEEGKAWHPDPCEPRWFAELAASLWDTGDLNGAVANYRKSLSLEPSDGEVEAEFGVALFESGRKKEDDEHL